MRDNVGILSILLVFVSFCWISVDEPPASGEVAVLWTNTHKVTEGEPLWESDYPKGLLPDEKININAAPWEDIDRLPSIGATGAKRIVEYRNQHGPFTEKIGLLKVEGIGLGTLDQIRDYITLE